MYLENHIFFWEKSYTFINLKSLFIVKCKEKILNIFEGLDFDLLENFSNKGFKNLLLLDGSFKQISSFKQILHYATTGSYRGLIIFYI